VAPELIAVLALGGEIGGEIPDAKSWCEIPAAAERADRRELGLEIRFAATRSIEKWWQIELLSGVAACPPVDERSVGDEDAVMERELRLLDAGAWTAG
jgi:hypothetical protein